MSSRLSRLKRFGLVEPVGSVKERRGAGNTVWRATRAGRELVALLAQTPDQQEGTTTP